MTKKRVDHTGKTYGYLTALKVNEELSKCGRTFWTFRCVCGSVVDLNVGNVVSGSNLSCGCKRSELMKARNELVKSGAYVGKVYGKLTALRPSIPESVNGARHWEFKCECGNVVNRRLNSVVSGGTRSCGCLLLKDYTGQKYEMLTCLEYKGRKQYGTQKVTIWSFRCDCGNIVEASINNVVNGLKTSCGCKKNFENRKRQRSNFTRDEIKSVLELLRDGSMTITEIAQKYNSVPRTIKRIQKIHAQADKQDVLA